VARIKGHPLDLAYKEFELLKYLSQNAGRVFSRSQLLQEVWATILWEDRVLSMYT